MRIDDTPKISNPSNQFLILSILLAGFILRIYDLGSESIWYDEGCSLNFAVQEINEIFFQNDKSPPLYYLFLHFWIKLFGTSEFSIRLPSAVFGTISIWYIYLIGKNLLNKKAALTGALLLSLNKYHIFYSQEARVYELTALMTLLSIYFFIRLNLQNKKWSTPGYLFFSSLLMYSHIYGLFIIFAQNIYILTTYKYQNRTKELFKWGLLQFCLLILFLPWLNVFLSQTIHAVEKGLWLSKPGLLSLINSFSILTGSRYLFLFYLIILLTFFFTQWQNRKSFSLSNFFMLFKQDRKKIGINRSSNLDLLFLWLFIPIALPFVISNISTPIFDPRYLIVSSPALYLLLGGIIVSYKNQNLRLIITALIILISVWTLLNYYSNPQKEQWRKISALIDNEAIPNDLVLFNSGKCLNRVFNYYSKGEKFAKKSFPENTRNVNMNNIQRLKDITDDRKRVWLILSHSGKQSYLINEEMKKEFLIKRKEDFIGIKLFLYEKKQVMRIKAKTNES